MPDHWTPSAINRLIVVGTAALGLQTLVLCVLLLITNGALSADLMGTAKGAGIGSGITGMASLLVLVIKIGLSTGTEK
jgi:hypothetical protein